jgi:hypothetical protein
MAQFDELTDWNPNEIVRCARPLFETEQQKRNMTRIAWKMKD